MQIYTHIDCSVHPEPEALCQRLGVPDAPIDANINADLATIIDHV